MPIQSTLPQCKSNLIASNLNYLFMESISNLTDASRFLPTRLIVWLDSKLHSSFKVMLKLKETAGLMQYIYRESICEKP